MLNKESPIFLNDYKNLCDIAYSDLHQMKKILNSDNENWEKNYRKCLSSFENLFTFQNANKSKVTDFDIFRSAYYLSWLENANYCRTSCFSHLINAKDYFYSIRKMNSFKDKWERLNEAEVDAIIRYYSRFIWICLLMNDTILKRDLLQEFKDFLFVNKERLSHEKYCIYSDCINRINYFINSLQVFNVKETNSDLYIIDTRLPSTSCHRLSRISCNPLTLSEVLIYSNNEKQVEFDCRTPDTFRMWHLFECLPNCDLKNPIKRVLNKPQLKEFKACILHSLKRLMPDHAFVCYISADDLNNNVENTDINMPNINQRLMVLYTRKPLLLIVDSKTSDIFRDLISPFDKPLICLLSPKIIPSELKYDSKNGNLFTLFLSCPISALCVICDRRSIEKKFWNSAQEKLVEFDRICLNIIRSTSSLERYLPFIGDPFMRRVVMRYCFCSIVLRCHKYFNKPEHLPFSNPAIDSILSENADLKQIISEISRTVKINPFF